MSVYLCRLSDYETVALCRYIAVCDIETCIVFYQPIFVNIKIRCKVCDIAAPLDVYTDENNQCASPSDIVRIGGVKNL